MKYYIFLLLLFSSSASICQSSETWTAFYNADTSLIGYKNQKGEIKIPAKLTTLTAAIKFDKIIATAEEKAGKWNGYYLTKYGRKVGKDSLHFFDNGVDCESEGFIRFRDNTTDKVGLFNAKGNVAIPAMYNDVSRVQNGLVVAIKGATKKIWEGGEHYSWEGGSFILLDTNNDILIEDFKDFAELNLFSLQISTSPTSDSVKTSYLGTNKKYYSFNNDEKEFKQWTKQHLLNNFSKLVFSKICFDSIVVETDKGWKTLDAFEFSENSFYKIQLALVEMQQPSNEFFILKNTFFPFDYSEQSIYFNNCGEANEERYPSFNIVINFKNPEKDIQHQLGFLKTNNGHKLIYSSLP